MYTLPTSIDLSGQEFAIRDGGDFRIILDCFTALDDIELTKQERITACLILFYEDLADIEDLDKLPDIEEAIEKMYLFFNCGETNTVGMKMPYKLIDWNKDSQLICSAINTVANTEIRAIPYLHWWTFMAYYLGIGECTLSNIINIRYKIAKGKKLEKYESQFKQENPQYFSWNMKNINQQEDDELVKQLWNKE